MKDQKTVELEQWLRTIPRSVEIARQFRNEGEELPAKDKDGNVIVQPKDPFEGVDLDLLPPEVKTKVEAARAEFALLQTNQTKLQKERDDLDARARFHQSRGDKAVAIGQRHNLLDGQGNPLTSQADVNARSAEEKIQEELVEAIIAQGIDPKAAPGFAKLLAGTQKILQRDTLSRVASVMTPTVGSLNDLQSRQLLEDAANETNDPDALLHDPDILAKVEANVALLVKNGNTISLEVIDNLKQMATGQVLIERQKKGKSNAEIFVQPRSPSRIGTRTPITGVSVAAPNFRGAKADIPVASNAETALAVTATLGKLLSGTNIKLK